MRALAGAQRSLERSRTPATVLPVGRCAPRALRGTEGARQDACQTGRGCARLPLSESLATGGNLAHYIERRPQTIEANAKPADGRDG